MGSTSKDSVNGLKFGQRIYFEDVGIGAPVKSGGGSSASASAPALGKKGGGPRCQVEGCRVDLSEAKAYYGKHKVCAVHSKTPVVIVNGIQQRFCQQCSRFHQLPEFDQGKRSCRRRLAGHNERRRKPPPRPPLLSSPYGRLPSSVFESSKGGGFLMNFSMYPKLPGRHTAIKAPNHSTPMGMSPPNMWLNDSGNASSTRFPQSLSSGTHYPTGPTIPSGECFTRASNSGSALSLLSNQPWGSRDVSFGPFASNEGAQMGQSTKPHGFLANQFSDVPRGFKGLEDVSKSKEMQPHLGLSQIAQPSDEIVGPSQHRQYVDLENSRAFDSSIQYMNWSL